MKLYKKIMVLTSTVILGLGITVVPVLAQSDQVSGWFNHMQAAMGQYFTPQEQQSIKSPQAMQELHNSPDMQKAMQNSDVMTMQELMSSNQELKNELDQDTMDKMDNMMSNRNDRGRVNE